MENPGLRKLRSRPVRLKDASKADPLRMVAAVAKRRTGGRRKRRNHLVRRETLRRKPSCRIGKDRGAEPDDNWQSAQVIQALASRRADCHLGLTSKIDEHLRRLKYIRHGANSG